MEIRNCEIGTSILGDRKRNVPGLFPQAPQDRPREEPTPSLGKLQNGLLSVAVRAGGAADD